MEVEIPRFWAWIETHSLTEFRRNCLVPRNYLNEGAPKEKLGIKKIRFAFTKRIDFEIYFEYYK
jgi:thiaminase